MSLRPAAWFSVLLALLAAGCGSAPEPYAWLEEDGATGLSHHGETVWRLRHARVPKPFFDLCLTDGTVMTWDRPEDHVWHHAHWFAWKFIDGLNYWEEDPETGRSEGAITWSDPLIERRADFSARISITLDYQPPGEPVLLTEQREIVIGAPSADGSYQLDWTMSFTAVGRDVTLDRTPIAGEEGGQVWGGYAGLSIRFAKELKNWQTVGSEGPIVMPESVTNHAVRGPLGLDLSGSVGAREAGIAILDHPDNLNAPTPWYIVMAQEQSFAFTEAALLYYDPVRIEAGDGFSLRYRVVVHEGRWKPEELQKQQEQFVEEVREE